MSLYHPSPIVSSYRKDFGTCSVTLMDFENIKRKAEIREFRVCVFSQGKGVDKEREREIERLINNY